MYTHCKRSYIWGHLGGKVSLVPKGFFCCCCLVVTILVSVHIVQSFSPVLTQVEGVFHMTPILSQTTALFLSKTRMDGDRVGGLYLLSKNFPWVFSQRLTLLPRSSGRGRRHLESAKVPGWVAWDLDFTCVPSLNVHNNPVTPVLLLFSFYRRGNWVEEHSITCPRTRDLNSIVSFLYHLQSILCCNTVSLD